MIALSFLAQFVCKEFEFARCFHTLGQDGQTKPLSKAQDRAHDRPCVAPGPRVTRQIPGRPVSFPYASAMFAAPASCRQTT